MSCKFNYHILPKILSLKCSYDRETFKDYMKGKPSEIHLTSSEIRAGSKIESSLLYEQPMQSLEEKGGDKVNNTFVLLTRKIGFSINVYVCMYVCTFNIIII